MRLLVLLLACSVLVAEEPTWPTGAATLRAPLADSEVVITTTPRLAGAIHSVTWRGFEFIDSLDHGRQLQSASNLDLGTAIAAETFNPTEAGARDDGAGPTSTSRLLHLLAVGNQLQTTTQMAFWLPPGGTSGGVMAKNTTKLSNHLLTKRVTIGYRHLPQVLDYRVAFHLPVGEFHRHAVFEAVTGYMPAAFEVFLAYDAATGQLQPLTDGPGEQSKPVVLATADRRFAMGVYSAHPKPAYGRFRFARERVTKWNCVFRVTHQEGIPAGDYSYQCFVLLGDVPLVQAGLQELHRLHPPE